MPDVVPGLCEGSQPTYEGLKHRAEELVAKWGVGSQPTYEGLKLRRGGDECAALVSGSQPTYEGLKRGRWGFGAAGAAGVPSLPMRD